MTKICTKCKIQKPLTDICKGGKSSWCKKCHADNEKLRRQTSDVIHYNENYQLNYYYGIDILTYDLMYREQKGVCAICEQPETQKVGETTCMLSVDHCHTTKAVRGLLCHKCNKGLGLFNDNLDYLNNAIKYLTNEDSHIKLTNK